MKHAAVFDNSQCFIISANLILTTEKSKNHFFSSITVLQRNKVGKLISAGQTRKKQNQPKNLSVYFLPVSDK